MATIVVAAPQPAQGLTGIEARDLLDKRQSCSDWCATSGEKCQGKNGKQYCCAGPPTNACARWSWPVPSVVLARPRHCVVRHTMFF